MGSLSVSPVHEVAKACAVARSKSRPGAFCMLSYFAEHFPLWCVTQEKSCSTLCNEQLFCRAPVGKWVVGKSSHSENKGHPLLIWRKQVCTGFTFSFFCSGQRGYLFAQFLCVNLFWTNEFFYKKPKQLFNQLANLPSAHTPHICHNHHNRWLCKRIQSGVKFSKDTWKKLI